jgi:hypothetical protein
MMAVNFGKTMSEIDKNLGDAANANASAALAPTKAALDSAQALAARYKEDPGSGQLVDLQSGQPFGNSAGIAPLTAEEAAVLGKESGDRVPIKLKNTASEIVNRGIKSVSAGGRQLLVDSQGNTIKDLGAATPVVTMNMMNPFAGTSTPTATGDAALAKFNPQQQAIIKGVANYTINPDQLPLYRSPQAKFQLLAAVKAYQPAYDETQYGTKSALRKSFTSGPDSQNIQALNTVAHHLNMLDQATDALGNGNMQILNQIGNAYNVKVAGQSPVVAYNAIKNAVSGELGNVFKKSGATDPEIASIGSTIQDSLSKRISKDVIGTDVGLVQGRLKALQFKYENGMQQPADFRIVSPEADQIFNRLGGNSGGQIQVQDPNGGIHIFPDQASAARFKQLAGIR